MKPVDMPSRDRRRVISLPGRFEVHAKKTESRSNSSGSPLRGRWGSFQPLPHAVHAPSEYDPVPDVCEVDQVNEAEVRRPRMPHILDGIAGDTRAHAEDGPFYSFALGSFACRSRMALNERILSARLIVGVSVDDGGCRSRGGRSRRSSRRRRLPRRLTRRAPRR
jgi:hypothetical protein